MAKVPDGLLWFGLKTPFSYLRKMTTLAQFFHTPAGAQLRRWEAMQLDRLLGHTLGEVALQLGAPFGDVLRSAPHGIKLVSVRDDILGDIDRAHCRLCFEALPYEAEAFDLVVLVHALDRCADYRQVINESLRVLVPQGRLVILSLNPWGPWWRRRGQKLANDLRRPLTVQEVRAALGESAQLDRGRFGVYNPSLSDDPHEVARWTWIEKAGDRWWPALANAYLLSAIKRETGMRLVGRAQKSPLLKKAWPQTVAAQEAQMR